MGEMDAFVAWLREQLRVREWSQADFARRLGVPDGTVSRWMHGQRPDTRYCDLIADALLVDVDTVLTLAGHRPRVEELGADDPRRELHALLDRAQLTQERYLTLRDVLSGWARRPPGEPGPSSAR